MTSASPAERARKLLDRMGADELDIVAAAEEARLVYSELGDLQYVLWLALEIGGYGTLTDSLPLHLVLGVREGDRLAEQVASYRTQVGWRWDPPAAGRLAHFFVEPLRELMSARDRVPLATVTGLVELTFGEQSGRADYPTSAEFSDDVFERILVGFTQTLELRLCEVAQ